MAQEKENAWVSHSKKFKSDVLGMRWKDDEDNRIRILPNKKGGKTNLYAYSCHWIDQTTGNRAPIFHSPNKLCKVCKLVNRLWSDVNRLKDDGYTDDSPEIKKKKDIIYSIRAKEMYDMNIIDRRDSKDDDGNIKIKRLAATPGISKHLIDLAQDEDWGSPSHDETGYDIKVTTSFQGDFKKFNVNPAGRGINPLTKEEIDALNKYGYDLAELRERDFTKEDRLSEILENAKRKELQRLALVDSKVVDDDEDEDEVVEVDEDEIEVEIDEEEEKPKKSKSKKKKEVVEEDDEDEDDDEEEEKPIKRSKSKKKKEVVEEDEDEDDEEEEKPKAKSKSKKKKEEVVEEDEDDDEDDEEEKPKAKSKSKKKEEVVEEDEDEDEEEEIVEDDEDDEEEKPKAKSKSKKKKEEVVEEDEDDDDEDEEEAFESLQCRGCYDEFDENCETCKDLKRCMSLSELKTKAEKAGIDIEDSTGKVKLEDELKAELKKSKKKVSKKIDF